MKKIPNPGSKEVLAKGCICPVLDNNYGKGAYEDERSFWPVFNCPLHRPNHTAIVKGCIGKFTKGA